MTLTYDKWKILLGENGEGCRGPFIGYYSPRGEIIRYSGLVGGLSHDDPVNPLSQQFLCWISYIIKDTSVENIYEKYREYNRYPGIEEIVKRGCWIGPQFNTKSIEEFYQSLNDTVEKKRNSLNRLSEQDPFEKMTYDLLVFFQRAYSNGHFFDTIGRKFYGTNKETVASRIPSWRSTEGAYYRYLSSELMQYVKDIYVQYLGYDSIERFYFGKPVKKATYFGLDSHEEFDRFPRTITTSCPNVYERFYNYMLMDWDIHRLPKYRYNEETGKYEEEPSYMQMYETEKEKVLCKEIKSIKKEVPLLERPQYFR